MLSLRQLDELKAESLEDYEVLSVNRTKMLSEAQTRICELYLYLDHSNSITKKLTNSFWYTLNNKD